MLQRIPGTIAVEQSRWIRVFSSMSYLPRPRQPLFSESNSLSNNPSSPIGSVIYENNVRLNNLGRTKARVQDARKLFDEMYQRDAFSYATMISIYLRSHDLLSAENLFLSIPQSARGVAAETAMISGYAKAGRLDDARKVFDEMPHRNVYSWTCMMSGYFDDGNVEEGERLFHQMPVKNVVSWTSLVQGYARNGLIDKARAEFDRMPEKNVVSWTVMMEGYIGIGRIDEALKLFGQLPRPNNYTWNVVIRGLLANERVNEAIELFNSMPSRSLISWTLMITGLADNRLIKLARDYFDHMPEKDMPAWNAMITAYSNEGLMVEAEELFNLMPEKNVITWNAIIDGYAKNGSKNEAFKHYNLMLRSSFLRPNYNTITSLVISCQGILELASCHSLVIKLGFGIYTILANALVSTYSRTGDFASARGVFKSLEFKDIVSWRAMMFACSDHGHFKHVLQAFSSMVSSGAEFDELTFLALLLACCRVGLVGKSKKILHSMKNVFGLEPKREHYTCVVDTLARSGKLEEAMDIIREMPKTELDEIVVGALLSSCRLHGDLEGMRFIREELIDHNIEADDSAGYVLLANTFAACEKWDEFAKVKKEMKTKEIKKMPGVSQIDVRGQTHVFFSGDKSRPELEGFFKCLNDDLQLSCVFLEEELV